MRWTPLALVACLCSPAAAAVDGRWWGSIEEDKLERIHFNLSYSGTSNMGTTFKVAEFTGLSRDQLLAGTETPVRFSLEREAGRVEFEGVFRARKGKGRFTFLAQPAYLEKLQELGVEDAPRDRHDRSAPQEERLLALALHDVSTDYIRALIAEGYHETLEQYLAMRIFDITPDHIRAMQELTAKRLTADELVATRVHGITPEFAREMRESGLDLSFDQLLACRIHGVTPEFREEVEQLGYRVSFEELLAFRIHGVTPEWIAELRELGYEHLDADELVSTRIFGVTAEFIRSVEAAGHGHLPMSELVEMRIHGVDADDMPRRRRM